MRKKKREGQIVKDLQAAIVESGLSYTDIERRSGVSHVTLSRFMRGQRTITLPVAAQLCDFLGGMNDPAQK